MIYAIALSLLAGYFIRAIVGSWKEFNAWKDGYSEGRKQAHRDLADRFEDVCTTEIAQRNAALRDKREVSEP